MAPYNILLECINHGPLPLNWPRAELVILPKKGEIDSLQIWSLVSALCMDFKIFSNALTNKQ